MLICELCLIKIESSECCSLINEEDARMLILYFSQMDTELLQGNICNCCKDKLTNCFNFKIKSLEAEEKIELFCENKYFDMVDLIGLHKNRQVCRMCLRIIENDDLLPLDEDNKMNVMMELCFPEIYLKFIPNISICHCCWNETKNTFNFIEMCSENLKEILYSKFETTYEYLDCKSKLLQLGTVKEVCDNIFNEFKITKTGLTPLQCTYKSNAKSLLENQMLIVHMKADEKMHKCTKCSYKSKRKYNLTKHMLVHLKSGQEMFSCTHCSYRTNRNSDLKRHMIIHLEMSTEVYKCTQCPYRTKRIHNLNKHLLMHLELKLFECTKCPYKAIKKCNLKSHMLTHSEAGAEMFACSQCPYKAKRKDYLKRHMLTHLESVTKVFYCAQCSYRTKMERNFKKHLLIHLESKTEVFECTKCNFKTVQKYSLKSHMLVHLEPGKEMFQCTQCEHKTKRKRDLKAHMLVHLEYGFKLFECTECSYKSKRKADLKRHTVRHLESRNIFI